ncbi:MAG: M20/M25/M40 family metallo-hydrolase [Phycisphaerae bacterium]|nr:M20/M25/M40 family metallo-hydrolase [Phycisphaerae bacterium]
MSDVMLDAVLAQLNADEEGAIGRWMDWLRIPSISTDPAYAGQTRQAATWAADQLRDLGFAVEIHETTAPGGKPGHPIVLAECGGGPGYKGPHVLFYGHYDVQPADPLDLWESPPFEPVRKPAEGAIGERVVARGAVDDKGQVMTFLEALRAWKKVSGLPAGGARFTVLLEGEEECGSVSLPAFVRAHRERLGGCDICLISDTGQLGRGKPAITYGVRGLAYTEVTLHAANQDLHSGLWGGRAPNPNNELAKVLAQLWDKERRVTIPGFYDAVRPLARSEREAWKRLKFNAAAALKKIGLPRAADIGEAGYTALEREWGRPTAEINGIWGGYTGAGAKTVIPAKASAKVSFRLVADQDPARITKMFFKWLRDRTPPGCRWELTDHHGGWGATVRTDSPLLAAAERAIKRASGKRPALIKSGGSIPVAGLLKAELGMETIFMGFGLDDDRVHSPNEKFELDCFWLGQRSHAAFIGELLTGAARA